MRNPRKLDTRFWRYMLIEVLLVKACGYSGVEMFICRDFWLALALWSIALNSFPSNVYLC